MTFDMFPIQVGTPLEDQEWFSGTFSAEVVSCTTVPVCFHFTC